jgi:hypothetical protein
VFRLINTGGKDGLLPTAVNRLMMAALQPEWRNWYTHQTQNLARFTPHVGSSPTSGTTSPNHSISACNRIVPTALGASIKVTADNPEAIFLSSGYKRVDWFSTVEKSMEYESRKVPKFLLKTLFRTLVTGYATYVFESR